MLQLLWQELGMHAHGELTAAAWEKFMVQFIRRQAERDANMFVVAPSTPAQLFHVLRRHANLPYQRPLVCATPKFLHHHRPATSALRDFTTGAQHRACREPARWRCLQGSMTWRCSVLSQKTGACKRLCVSTAASGFKQLCGLGHLPRHKT